MSHPLEAYLCETKNGAITDDQARDSIADLVNDQGLMQEVCAMFVREINGGDRCFAVGKVYDVEDKRHGCLTILSEDVVNVIGQDFVQKTHEDMNYSLLCAYIEYRRFCMDASTDYAAWDDYLDFTMRKNFVSLYKNGVRARLIHTDSVDRTAMPTIVFIIYLNYGQW